MQVVDSLCFTCLYTPYALGHAYRHQHERCSSQKPRVSRKCYTMRFRSQQAAPTLEPRQFASGMLKVLSAPFLLDFAAGGTDDGSGATAVAKGELPQRNTLPPRRRRCLVFKYSVYSSIGPLKASLVVTSKEQPADSPLAVSRLPRTCVEATVIFSKVAPCAATLCISVWRSVCNIDVILGRPLVCLLCG